MQTNLMQAERLQTVNRNMIRPSYYSYTLNTGNYITSSCRDSCQTSTEEEKQAITNNYLYCQHVTTYTPLDCGLCENIHQRRYPAGQREGWECRRGWQGSEPLDTRSTGAVLIKESLQLTRSEKGRVLVTDHSVSKQKISI